MSLYLDTSVLVALFVEEAGSRKAQEALLGQVATVSDFAVAEFSAAIARRVRAGELPQQAASAITAAFDAWRQAWTSRVALDPLDGPATIALVRQDDLALRAPDALHIAIAARLGARLFTFDNRMAAAATAMGLAVLT